MDRFLLISFVFALAAHALPAGIPNAPTDVLPIALANDPITALTAAVPTVCNGRAELCRRSYGNITFFGSHDSYAFSSDALALARDQEVPIANQLALGVRLLQTQAHLNAAGVLHFCHTSCALFDGGSVSDYLTIVKTFMDANPTEILTLLLTNPDHIDVAKYWVPVLTASGLLPMTYTPPPSAIPLARDAWPTLGEMIGAGTRLVLFMDYHTNLAAAPYLLPEFEMIWETQYGYTDAKFPCSVDRTSGPLIPVQQMYMINHSLNDKIIGTLILPDRAAAPKTNSVSSVSLHASNCAQYAQGRAPSFVLMDWVNIGEGKKAADIFNGVS